MPRNLPNRFEKYGVHWLRTCHPLSIEMDCIKMGGKWQKKDGTWAGMGKFYHYKRFQEICWPEKKWHRWAEEELKAFLDHTYIGEMGCAAAGKSDNAVCSVLTDWYCFPDETTVLVSSTDLASLDLRVWGMIKRYHRLAKERFSWLPGHLIEGRRVIVVDHKSESAEGRDFRNGLIAVPVKKGSAWVGLGPLVGLHNKRVRLVADESNLMPRVFIDSTANLSKCPDFKLVALGNPNETTNAHGFVCEPATELGGWEGGIDQTPKTKTWKTRLPNGICLQLPGSDSPNMDVPEGEDPPFPFLMTRKQMEDDAQIWGVDDWHYTMMNEARMPRGQGSRRVVTRQMCEKFGALIEPQWRDTQRTKIAFLDAAYRGVGGDRCVFGELQFGYESEADLPSIVVSNVISQKPFSMGGKQIIGLIDTIVIPITAGIATAEQPEDQIVKFVRNQCEARGIPPENVFIESGMKTSLVTAFSRLWSPLIESVDCGGRASEDQVSAEIKVQCRDYYSKFVTELWYSVRLCIEARQFRGLSKEVMWEFCSREWKNVSGNRIEVESKVEMKAKTGRSPDLADAVAVGVYGARKRGFVIQRLTSPTEKRTRMGRDWRDEIREKAKLLVEGKQLNYAA